MIIINLKKTIRQQNIGLNQDQQLKDIEIPFRVYPGKLSVSRTIGDAQAKLE